MQIAKCKIQNAKYKMPNKSSNCNCKYECDAFLYPFPSFFVFFFLQKSDQWNYK